MGKRNSTPLANSDVAEDFEQAIKDEPTKPRIRTRETTESLKVDLTQDEWNEASTSLADGISEIHSIENKEASIKAQIKSEKTACEAKIERLRGLVSNRYEYRTVPVEVQYDYSEGKVRKVRLDTGEIFHEREMVGDERQSSLV